MRQVGQQAVGNIDARAGDPAQCDPQRQPRLGTLKPRGQGGRHRVPGLPLRQRPRGIAERAADPDIIPDPCAAAAQGLAGRHEAMHGHADRQRAAGGVAAHQGHPMFARQRIEAVEEPGHERRIGVGQRERERAPGRRGPHRREVGQVHRQRFPANVGRRGPVGEMHAGVEGVHRHHQLHARWRLQQRRVVADPEDDVGAAGHARLDGGDQRELGHDPACRDVPLSADARPAPRCCAGGRRPCPARR